MRNSVSRASGFSIKVALGAPTVTGRRLFVSGKRGPAFTAPTASPACTDCRDFQTVIVRQRRSIVSVDCTACASDNDMPTRIPTGSPQPSVSMAGNPKLPLRPTPHERDGRQPAPQPARPHGSLPSLAR
ncbi:hypothetical protein [Streptomyces sp. NPDC001815]|uniref:hypothetical protein n=1 Tax=Streptomyces sp. NPDC001815 TaxID=3154526 RepID=UPI00332B5F20